MGYGQTGDGACAGKAQNTHRPYAGQVQGYARTDDKAKTGA